MKWYAICGPGLKVVTTNWKQVEDLSKIYPYCSYRRFFLEEDARHFAESHKRAYDSISVSKYGNTFEKFFIGMSYIIDRDVVYYSFDKSRVGNIRLIVPEGVPVKYTAKAALVKIHQSKPLDKQLIADNLKAIINGVKMLGTFVDVDITIPNFSLFYVLTLGYDKYQEYIDFLKRRDGKFSVTYKGWRC